MKKTFPKKEVGAEQNISIKPIQTILTTTFSRIFLKKFKMQLKFQIIEDLMQMFHSELGAKNQISI
jgi:hypothetical protein